MTAADVLGHVVRNEPIPGRHLVLVAHPDDEVISATAALCCLEDVRIVQLTQESEARDRERIAAQQAAGWSIPVRFGQCAFRQAHLAAERLRVFVGNLISLRGITAVWTHPYEGGHLDHDTAAWIGQTVERGCLRLEFASYHATETGQAFGDFWPDAQHPTVTVTLDAERWARKQAAIAAYGSQASILHKFPHPDVECYREAPVYDFSRPAPPPRARWDVKGHQPSTAAWRETIARVAA